MTAAVVLLAQLVAQTLAFLGGKFAPGRHQRFGLLARRLKGLALPLFPHLLAEFLAFIWRNIPPVVARLHADCRQQQAGEEQKDSQAGFHGGLNFISFGTNAFCFLGSQYTTSSCKGMFRAGDNEKLCYH